MILNKKKIIITSIICLLAIIFFILNKKNVLAENIEPSPETRRYFSLRDEMIITNKNQKQFGLCWDFAGTRTLETAFSKHYNELIQLSEGYTATRKKPIGIGAISGFADTYYSFLNNGVVLEQDFPYQFLYYANSKRNYNSIDYNQELFFDHYDSKKIDLLSYFKPVRDLKLDGDMQKIKYHLANHSALYYDIINYNYYENLFNNTIVIKKLLNSPLEGHAITIIGWDDDYKVNSTEKGAFICVNSNNIHKGGGICYLPYTFRKGHSDHVDGYEFIKNTPEIISKRTNNSTIINSQYQKDNTNITIPENKFLSLNNVFAYKEQIDIDYSFKNINNPKHQIKIYKNNIDCTNVFTITNTSSTQVNIKKESPSYGCYKVVINYKDNNNTVKQEIREIYILSEIETQYTQNSFTYNNGYSYTLYNYDNFNNTDNQLIISQDGRFKLNYFYNPYSKINKIEYGGNIYDVYQNGVIDKLYIDYTLPSVTLNTEKIDSLDVFFHIDNGKKIKKTYKLIKISANKNYFFPFIMFKNNDYNYQDNFYNIFPISTNKDSIFYKYYLPNLTNISSYDLTYKNHKKQTIKVKKDTNGYYIDGKECGDLLFTGHIAETVNMSNISHRKTFFINVTDNNKPVISQKNTYNHFAYDTLEKEIIKDNILVTINGVSNTDFEILNITYKNGNSLLYGDISVDLSLKINGSIYNFTYNVKVFKKIISLSSNISKTFFYDNTEKHLNIPLSSDYTISNNAFKEIGVYPVLVKIIDKDNLCFENGLNELELKLEIKEPIIEDIEFLDNTLFNVVAFDEFKLKGKIKAFLNKNYLQKIELTYIGINYNSPFNYFTCNNLNVTFNLSFYNYIFTYDKTVNCIRKTIAIPVVTNNLFFYDGLEKELSISISSDYIIRNNKQSQIGNHIVSLDVSDSINTVFENNNSSVNLDLIIKEPLIKDVTLKNRNDYNLKAFDKFKLTDKIIANINNIPDQTVKLVSITYKNNNNVTCEDTFITLTLSFKDYHFIQKIDISVSPIILNNTPLEKIYKYDGSTKKLDIIDSNFYTVSKNSFKDAGEYIVTISLKDCINYRFLDNKFIIENKLIILKTKLKETSLNNNVLSFEQENIEYKEKENRNWKTYNGKRLNAGSYIFRVKENNNYEPLEITIKNSANTQNNKLNVILLSTIIPIISISISILIVIVILKHNKNKYNEK